MVTIRPVPVDHADARGLLEEYFALRAAIFPGGAYTVNFPPAGAFGREGEAFVVLYDDEGAAMGCGAIRRLDDGDAGPRFEVKHLYVRDAGRGRGWGRVILDDVERRAREAGAAELVLDTHHTLEAAGGLYARSGFASIEPYNDNPNATVWLRKTL
jgi:GNAT superfamily N-acetyltransferase